MYFFVTGTKPQLPFQTEHIILYYVKNGARAPAPLHQNIGFSTTKKSKAFEKSFGANIFMHCILPGGKAAKAPEPMP